MFAHDYAKRYCIKYDYCKSDYGGGVSIWPEMDCVICERSFTAIA